MSRRLLLIPVLVLLVLSACRELEVLPETAAPYTVVVSPDGRGEDFDALLHRLASKRVIYVGETHTRYGHHLLQLKMLQGLQALGVDLAIGMEAFQQPFQRWLDDWVAGRIDEATLIEKTQWYDRWRFDYRLYRPILRFARAHRIPVVALNVPRELTDAVSERGLAGLSPQERARLPRRIDRSDPDYRKRLHEVFIRHRGEEKKGFERFLDVQYSWDEGMAREVVRYLKAHPRKTMVVLAGAGHIAWGSGIPARVARRLPASQAIVLPADKGEDPRAADYWVVPEPARLSPRPLLGVYIEPATGGVRVAGLTPGSGAEQAGLQQGDLIVALDGRPVQSMARLRLQLLEHRPGDRVAVKVQRNGQVRTFTVVLGRSPH